MKEDKSPEYLEALEELNAITDRILGCSLGEHKWEWDYNPESDRDERDWWRCSRCGERQQEVELERESILDRRRWRAPTGEVSTEAYSDDAVDLLLNNPEEYFRLREKQLEKSGYIRRR